MISLIGISLILLSIVLNIYAASKEYKARQKRKQLKLNGNDWAYWS